MSDAVHSSPARFAPDVETIPDGEADAIKGPGEQVKAIQEAPSASRRSQCAGS